MRRGLVAVSGLALLLAHSSGAAGAQALDPKVMTDRTGTAAGETIVVTGAAWPAGSSLVVELCGQGGLRGSIDCDVPNQRVAAAGPSGTFGVELPVALPPSPCPCVVKVTDQSSHIGATAPIAIAGLATVPITGADLAAARSLEISDAVVSGGGTVGELFGAGGRRVLEITLVNTGAVPVESPDVDIAWGSGDDPTGFVEPPTVDRMDPGDVQVLTVPLRRSVLTIGTQTAVVSIHGVGADPIVARASTTGYPWGLVAVALVVVQLLLLRLRNRLRRRVRRAGAEPVGPAVLAGRGVLGLPPGPVLSDDEAPHDVIDLDAEEATPGPWPLPTGGDEVATPVPAPEPEPARPSSDEVLRAAEAEGASLVESALERLRTVSQMADERLARAEAEHESELELLDAVWQRATELSRASQAALADRRREVDAEVADAREALAAAESKRASLLAAAHAEIARLDAEAVAAQAALHVPDPSSRAPRIGDLDMRFARAVQRALSSMGSGTTG